MKLRSLGSHNNAWVRNIDSSQCLTFEHIEQFATLWEKLSNVILTPGVDDAIFWKFTKDGVYSASSAYNAQFEGHTASAMITTV